LLRVFLKRANFADGLKRSDFTEGFFPPLKSICQLFKTAALIPVDIRLNTNNVYLTTVTRSNQHDAKQRAKEVFSIKQVFTIDADY